MFIIKFGVVGFVLFDIGDFMFVKLEILGVVINMCIVLN